MLNGPRERVAPFGVAIIRRSIEEPLQKLVANCGEEGSIVVNKIREGSGNFDYNAGHDHGGGY